MRKRQVALLVALGVGGGLGIGIATAGGGTPPSVGKAPTAARDLGQKLGTGATGTFSGAVEVPAGDPDGTGTALIRLNPAEGLVCFKLVVRGIDPPSAAHIHQAPLGQAGPVVVPLPAPAANAADPSTFTAKGCVSADAGLIRTIKASPGQFYVNVHNKAFPAGAVRAQLKTLNEKTVLVCKSKKRK